MSPIVVGHRSVSVRVEEPLECLGGRHVLLLLRSLLGPNAKNRLEPRGQHRCCNSFPCSASQAGHLESPLWALR